MPASDHLRSFSGEYPIEARDESSLGNPSSRPTVAPDEVEALALISATRDSLPHEEIMAEMMHMASVGPSVRPLEREEAAAPAPLVPVNPRRRNAARVIFAVLFGGALTLFGYAFQPRISAALHGAGTPSTR